LTCAACYGTLPPTSDSYEREAHTWQSSPTQESVRLVTTHNETGPQSFAEAIEPPI
jgi:hypothetical protein